MLCHGGDQVAFMKGGATENFTTSICCLQVDRLMDMIVNSLYSNREVSEHLLLGLLALDHHLQTSDIDLKTTSQECQFP